MQPALINQPWKSGKIMKHKQVPWGYFLELGTLLQTPHSHPPPQRSMSVTSLPHVRASTLQGMNDGVNAQDTARSNNFNQVHGQLLGWSCTSLEVQEQSSLRSLVRCRRWNPFMNLLSSGGIRNVLLWSGRHIEFMVCPDEFTSSRWISRRRVVSHAVKPAVPLRRHHASIHIPECVFAVHLGGVDDPSVAAKKLLVVFVVFISIFVFSHQCTNPYIICPEEDP